MGKPKNPLRDGIPREVPLPKSPLARVIAQVRFPSVLSINDPAFIAPFQEAIRRQYPRPLQERTQELSFTPNGVTPGNSAVIWRFCTMDDHWKVSLCPFFLSIETAQYTSRADFFERFSFLLSQLDKHFSPAIVERLGVRYIDRVKDPELKEIEEMVRPEMLGILPSSMRQEIVHQISDCLLRPAEADSSIVARWGKIPENITVDPGAIEVLDVPSWILDLDMFSTAPMPFETSDIIERSHLFARRIYAVFRWAVTDHFLKVYGGDK